MNYECYLRLIQRLFFTLHSSSLCVSTLGLKVNHQVPLQALSNSILICLYQK